MPWIGGAPDAGFSTVASPREPWLPLDPEHDALAVDRQDRDPESTLAFARQMLALRREHAALRTGTLTFVDAPEPLLAFERSGEHPSDLQSLMRIPYHAICLNKTTQLHTIRTISYAHYTIYKD